MNIYEKIWQSCVAQPNDVGIVPAALSAVILCASLAYGCFGAMAQHPPLATSGFLALEVTDNRSYAAVEERSSEPRVSRALNSSRRHRSFHDLCGQISTNLRS